LKICKASQSNGKAANDVLFDLLVQVPHFAEQLAHATPYLRNCNEQIDFAKLDACG
jgi:hypothetical protein